MVDNIKNEKQHQENSDWEKIFAKGSMKHYYPKYSKNSQTQQIENKQPTQKKRGGQSL